MSNQHLLRLGTLLAIVGMLLPIYGPMLDQGYAEDIPGHAHVLLAGGSLEAHESAPDDSTGVLALPDLGEGAFSVVLAALAVAFAVGIFATGMAVTSRTRAFPRAVALARWAEGPPTPPPRSLLTVNR